LPIVWSARTGEGYGNGVASQGRWFQFDRFGSVERLTCFNAENGEPLWNWESPVTYTDMYGYNSGPRASPVVAGEDVIVYGVTGTLACVRVADGAMRWQRAVNQDYGVIQNFFGVGVTPLVHQGLVIVMVGGSPPSLQKVPLGQLDGVVPNGSGMVAFDLRDGREVYRTGSYLASYSAPIAASTDRGQVGLALMREGLSVFDLMTGKPRGFFPWRSRSLESVNAASPIVLSSDRILISETYEIGSAIVEWDGASLKEQWRDVPLQKAQLMRSHWATPILIGDYLYGSSGRNEPDADLRCVDIKNRKVMWVHRNRERCTLLAVDGHLLVLTEHGQLQLIRQNPEKYDPVAQMDLEVLMASDGLPLLQAPTWAPPVLSHGLLYLRGNHRLVCLELIPQ
jgi:outer membrane protein assembly factor BamB